MLLRTEVLQETSHQEESVVIKAERNHVGVKLRVYYRTWAFRRVDGAELAHLLGIPKGAILKICGSSSIS